jgi:hypothetical protein
MSDDAARDPEREREYLEAVETQFRRLRARPMVLSPEDTRRVLDWCRKGVPLSLVIDAMRTVFHNAAARRPRRLPRSLAYVEPAVEEAWQEVQEGRVGQRRDTAPPVDPELGPMLDEAARAVRGSWAPSSARDEAARQLERIAAGDEEAFGEDVIGQLEARLLEACLEALPAAERDELERRAASDIAAWADEMSPEVRDRALERARAQRVRERFGLPDLGLLPLIG